MQQNANRGVVFIIRIHAHRIFVLIFRNMRLGVLALRSLAAAAFFICFAEAAQAQFVLDGLDSKAHSSSRTIIAQPTSIYSPKTVSTINQNIVTGTDSLSSQV